MGAIDIVTAFNNALNAQQWDTAASYLTDDFTFSGVTPQPLGKMEFLAGQRQWIAGVPDWRITLEELREEGNSVRATAHITGVHTNTLALPGQPPLPATGKQFSVRDTTTATMRGDKIAAINTVTGSPGILEQLGVQPPTA
jgi:predicted ester cyclase